MSYPSKQPRGVCRLILIGFLALPCLAEAPSSRDEPLTAWLDGQMTDLLELYHTLHAHPELSFQEEQTSRRIAEQLAKLGAEVTEKVGGFGVVGLLRNGNGPAVLVRTDLDALPITEATGLPYASQVEATTESGERTGVMHACGHDIHMTNLIGTARWLAEHRDAWSGTVVFIAQPAEERAGGAKAMLADGLYERFPKPAAALAIHVNPSLEAGRVGYVSGPAYAGVSSVDLTVRGRGGHGAYPHRSVDPIAMAATLIVDLQTIVSREIKPTEPAVLTVGSIHGGSKHNIIPTEVQLQMTLRSYDEAVMDQLISGIQRRAEALAIAHQAPAPSLTISERTPPTINDPALVQRILPALQKAIGADQVVALEPVMGAEDFGRYATQGVPIFMYSLGSVGANAMADSQQNGTPLPSIHSPYYAPDAEPTLRTGIRTMTSAVLELLPPTP